MATKREIEGYRRRLAKIEVTGDLTAECLGAVVQVKSVDHDAVTGTLVSFTHRQELGLFGMVLATDVKVCTACVGRTADCSADDEVELTGGWLLAIVRNATEDLVDLEQAAG